MAHTRSLMASFLCGLVAVLSFSTAFAKDLGEINFPTRLEGNQFIQATVQDPPIGIFTAPERTDANEGIRATCKTGFIKEGYQGNEGLCGALLANEALKRLQEIVSRFKCSDTSGKEITYSIGHQSFSPDTARAPIVFAETSEITCEENPAQVTRGIVAGKADQWPRECSEKECSAVFKPSKTNRAYFYVPSIIMIKTIPKIDLGE